MGFRCNEYLNAYLHKNEELDSLVEIDDSVHVVNNTYEDIENHRERIHGKDVLFIMDPRWSNK